MRTGLSCDHLEKHVPTGMKNKEFYCRKKRTWVYPLTCQKGCHDFTHLVPFAWEEDVCAPIVDDMAVELL